jgi:hypothetical protein
MMILLCVIILLCVSSILRLRCLLRVSGLLRVRILCRLLLVRRLCKYATTSAKEEEYRDKYESSEEIISFEEV